MNPLSRLLRRRYPDRRRGASEASAAAPGEAEPSQRNSINWMEFAKDVSGIVVSLGAAIGILGSAITYILTEKAKHDEAQRTQLTTYKTYGAYLSLYRDSIQPLMGELLRDSKRRSLEEEALALRKKGQGGSSAACTDLIQQSTTHTGFEVFSSPKYSTYRSMHNFFESIGYALSQGQLDFEIIFDLITLPNYWSIHEPASPWYLASGDLMRYKTAKTYLYPDFSVMLPLRACIGDNYFGMGKPLHDFSDSIDMLGFNYLFARMRSLYRRECWPDETVNHSKYNSPVVVSSPGAEALSACQVLRRRLMAMKQANGKPASWMTLYSTTPVDIDPAWTLQSAFTGSTRLKIEPAAPQEQGEKVSRPAVVP